MKDLRPSPNYEFKVIELSENPSRSIKIGVNLPFGERK